MIDHALRSLGPEERVAWMLRNVEGLPLAEVALACECSLATAKRRIATAERDIRAVVKLEDRRQS